MATHKSAKKRIRTNERKREVNKAVTSSIKTHTKKLLATTNKEEAEKLYKETVSILDRNAAKSKIHRNTAARKKSRLTKHLNKLQPAEAKK